MALRIFSVLLVLLVPMMASGVVQAADQAALWEALRTQPNMVVVMRHGEVAGGRDPTQYDPSGKCRGENMLTRKGRVQSADVGKLFAANGLPPERLNVVSSAMCRTRDTAIEAFGKAELDPELREFMSGGGERMNAAMDAAEGWIRKLRGDMPLILITHFPNIDALTAEQIEYGQAVVAESDDQGYLDVVGILEMY